MNHNGHSEAVTDVTPKAPPPPPYPAYKSHKTVRAFKIGSVRQTPAAEPVEGGSWDIIPLDTTLLPARVSHAWYEKHRPSVDGYFVQYADEYESFSPGKAFEEGNTLLTDLPAAVTPQYLASKLKEAYYVIMPDGRTTICLLTFNNGFTVTGTSTSAPSTEFNKEQGEQWAYDDAFTKAWPYEVFLLAEKQAGG